MEKNNRPPRKPAGSQKKERPDGSMRLNQFLARAGLASRRGAEELIRSGAVQVNGTAIMDLATWIDPQSDIVEVNDQRVKTPKRHTHLMMHKPAGVDVTRADPYAELTVFDLLPHSVPDALQAVGRLDRPTTGLLLLTTDGDLAYRLTHPKYAVEKEYVVTGDRMPNGKQLYDWTHGVELEDGNVTALRAIKLQPNQKGGPGVKLVIREGKKRVVRRMCKAVDYKLLHLHRSRIGPLRLTRAKEGKFRPLSPEEIAGIYEAAGLGKTDPRKHVAGPSRPDARTDNRQTKRTDKRDGRNKRRGPKK